ncbi:MAG TPA: glycosyltransferase [Actinomycetota bacterium]|nr:glycosyltransferase [Actinomycetota bacterium]
MSEEGQRPEELPEDLRRLVEERQAARARRDFALADRLRERIREAGFEVADTPAGPVLRPRPSGAEGGAEGEAPRVYRRSDEVESVLGRPPTAEASVQWVVQGWPEDAVQGVEAFRRHQGDRTVHYLVVEAAGLLDVAWPGGVEVLHLAPEAGWAAARNAGLRRAAGRVVVLVDGSVEPTGDVLGPLERALADPTVGLTGPFGLVTEDLREFRESPGPEVDAVEAYLMALRRELVEAGLRFDEKFRFYRTADIELSFQVKARGFRCTVTPLPLARHEHRLWAATPEEERARLSRRNFYRFLDRWRGRTDLLVSRRG